MRLSGTFRRPAWFSVVRLSGPAFPDGCSEAREDFGPLIGLEPKEEEVVLVPDFAEEALPRQGTSKQPEDRLEERIPALIVHWPPNNMQRERQCRLRLFRVPIPKHYEQVVEVAIEFG
jgi:hypothetical protein